MWTSTLKLGTVSASLIALLATSPIWAGSITGTVCDQGKNPPNGISGVKVQLRQADGKMLDIKGITDTDGTFTLKDVPDGEFTIVLDKVGYIPRPDEIKKVKVNGLKSVGELKLMQAYASVEYYEVIAGKIHQKASDGPNAKKKEFYTAEWNRLRVTSLPPSSKALLTTKLVKEDEAVLSYVPETKQYLNADAEFIRKAETRFKSALSGNASMPSEGDFVSSKLGPVIIADIVLLHARNVAIPEKNRKAFVEEFLGTWKGGDAAKIFSSFQKEGLDKIPTLLLEK